MTDQNAFERIVADSVRSIGPVAPSDGAHELTSTRVRQSRQDPEWLALIKEPPMRSNSQTAVGSPTVRLVAILAATMLLAVALAAAGAGAQRLLAADAQYIVAPDGSGTHTSVAAAIADATDGDHILIRPGTYAETILTDKSVLLEGDGPAADIVITHTDAGPGYGTGFASADLFPSERGPDDDGYSDWTMDSDQLGTTIESTEVCDCQDQRFALVLLGTTAEISNLTFGGQHARLFIDGGSPVIDGVTFDDVGLPFTPANSEQSRFTEDSRGNTQALVITGGATPTVQESLFVHGGGIDVYGDASPLVADNTLEGGPSIYGLFGDDTRIVDNSILGPGDEGVTMGGDSAAIVQANVIEDKTDGMFLYGLVTAESNEIRNSTRSGITVVRGEPTVRNNNLFDNAVAVDWERGDGLLEGNRIAGGGDGFRIGTGALVVKDNVIEGVRDRGIFADSMSTPVLTGNRSCGNGEDFVAMGTSRPETDGTNEICDGSGA